MAESVVVGVLLHGKAGREEELADRLRALVLASRLDPGVITYDLHRSTENPALWFLYEHYESQEYLNRHLENTVLRSFVADAATLVDGSIDVRTFKMVSEFPGAKRKKANHGHV